MGNGWFVKANGISAAQKMLKQISIDWDGNTVYVAGPTTEYAVYHEFGTYKMPARPFMRPAAQRVKANPMTYAEQIASENGIELDNEANLVRCVAMAIADQGRRIAREKDVHKTGQTIGSIQARKR